jgi:superfamily II DNA helicase RecQ
MRVKVVTLQYAPSRGGFDERPLADLIRDKEILAVREHFFSVHDLPHLACLITYQQPTLPIDTASGEASAPRSTGRAPPSDVTADLAPEERAFFGALREWRSARAREEGVPPYMLFTNSELVRIVKARPATPNALQALDGIGAGKVERYAKQVLERVKGAATAPAPPSPSPDTRP